MRIQDRERMLIIMRRCRNSHSKETTITLCLRRLIRRKRSSRVSLPNRLLNMNKSKRLLKKSRKGIKTSRKRRNALSKTSLMRSNNSKSKTKPTKKQILT
jgi:hypothetical protein